MSSAWKMLFNTDLTHWIFLRNADTSLVLVFIGTTKAVITPDPKYWETLKSVGFSFYFLLFLDNQYWFEPQISMRTASYR